VLRELGVRTVGRIVGIRDGAAQFSGSLRNHCAMADLKLDRLLDTFDEWAHEQGLDREIEPEPRPRPTGVDASPCLRLDLASAGIETVVWATGFRPDYSWLQAPAFDAKGRLQHDGGIVSVPGLYVMGLPFLRRRRSSFIHGAGPDAYDLSEHLVRYLRCGTAPDLQRAAGL
jgi:putative flavoprotein involved in K+ transport